MMQVVPTCGLILNRGNINSSEHSLQIPLFSKLYFESFLPPRERLVLLSVGEIGGKLSITISVNIKLDSKTILSSFVLFLCFSC